MREERPGRVLSLVERGWQAARERSLDLSREGIGCVHIVKGRLSRAVHELIAPVPHVRIISLPRRLFWHGVWLLLIGAALTGRARSVLVDNERSYRRLAWWRRWAGIEVALV